MHRSSVDQAPTQPTPGVAAAPVRTRGEPGWVLALGAMALGGSVGVALAAPSGYLVGQALLADCHSDGWCEVGALILAMLVSSAIGAIGYVAAGVVAITRWRRSGERWKLIAAHVGAPVALATIGLLVGLV